MKKITIYAYMEGNLGDDLMVWVLCSRYPHVRFRLWADESYKVRFRELKNLTVYSPGNSKVVLWNRIAEKIRPGKADVFQLLVKKADALVHIGGSIYIQHDHYETTYHMDRALRSMSRRMYTCGANFGPYTDEAYYQQYYELLALYDGVCFRDRYSFGLFEHLPNVRYAPDVVFNYPIGTTHIPEKKQVLISVIQLKDRKGKFALAQYAADYRNFLAEMAEYYIDAGYQVKFVSFCKAQGDLQAAREIVEAIEEKKRGQTDIYSYETDIGECIGLFQESEIVVGTRFHSVILGWLAGKRVLPIIYDTKTLHLLEDNRCRIYVTMDQIKGSEIPRLAEQTEKLDCRQRESLIKEAQGQFLDLDKLLNETGGIYERTAH